jgi:hypothetical protein
MSIRFFGFLCACGALLFAPVISFLIGGFLLLKYRAIEFVFLALCLDMLFLPPGTLPLATLLTTLMVWGFEPLRREFA